ncbi:hypothetical protein C8R45DRAFT_933122 [Mycena sanguinolenta]|nr:hypothetical protein C8R45DRAFT_933122 [Mycena sanguinolenta]
MADPDDHGSPAPGDHGSPDLPNHKSPGPPDANDKPPQRRVVDFDLKDSDWEDEPDGKLPGLGTTTHCSCNPQLSAHPLCKQKRRIVAGSNVKATAAQWREERGKRLEVLAEDLDAWEVEQEKWVHELAEKHGMKVKEVRHHMLALSTYGARRKVSLYNAKISRVMGRLNSGHGVGERYTMPEVKRMAAEDPLMLEGFMEEDKKEMIAQITNLAERVGMIGFALFSHGHVHDTTLPVTIELWGTMEFFREVLKKDPVDVSTLFKLWAVSCKTKSELLGMQQEAMAIIHTGLPTILGITKSAMNYESYILKLVQGKGVGLVNWPNSVEFKRMSLQSAVGLMQILLDSLKSGMTRWKILTTAEKKKLTEQYNEMVESREVKVKDKTKKTKECKVQKAVIAEDEEEEEEGRKSKDGAQLQSKPTAKSKAAPKPASTTKSKPAASRKAKPTCKPSVHDGDKDDDDAPARKTKHVRKSTCDEDEDEDNEDDSDAPPRKMKPMPKSKPVCKSTRDDDDEDNNELPARNSKPAAKSKPTHDDEDDEPPPTQLKAPKRGTEQQRLWELLRQGQAINDEKQNVAKGTGGGGRGGKEHCRKHKRAEREDDNEEEEVPVPKKKGKVDGQRRAPQGYLTSAHRHALGAINTQHVHWRVYRRRPGREAEYVGTTNFEEFPFLVVPPPAPDARHVAYIAAWGNLTDLSLTGGDSPLGTTPLTRVGIWNL